MKYRKLAMVDVPVLATFSATPKGNMLQQLVVPPSVPLWDKNESLQKQGAHCVPSSLEPSTDPGKDFIHQTMIRAVVKRHVFQHGSEKVAAGVSFDPSTQYKPREEE
jgi:hypothetical protein